MIDKNVFDQVAGMCENDTCDVMYGLVEEVGELALALHVRNGTKRRILKESAEIECIDIILLAVEMYIKLGGTWENMGEIAANKLQKWQNAVNEMRDDAILRVGVDYPKVRKDTACNP